MKNRRNYYRVLHVQHDAPAEIIRTSYRTLMHRLKMHPDLGGNHWQASLLNEAYAILSNPNSRAAYDRDVYSRVNKKCTTAKNDGHNTGKTTPRSSSTRESSDDNALRAGHCFFCHTVFSEKEVSDENECAKCFRPLNPAMWHMLKSQIGGVRLSK